MFKSNLDEVIHRITNISKVNVTTATEYMREKVVDKVSGTGDGKIYTVPCTKVKHQSSSEGNPPALMTGYLAGHIQTAYDEEDGGLVQNGYFGPQDIPYAKRLEFGFVGEDALGRNYNQAPRPYMSTTTFEEEDAVKRILRGGEP